MRVIAGKSKGTRLSSFKGNAIRPTLDRVKESLFNQISPFIKGASFLDLFAGTGSIGIEAMSRNASDVVFVEDNPNAQDLVYSNLKKCRLINESSNNWQLIKLGAHQAIELLEKKQNSFDLVYVDPPFEKEIYDSCLLKLANSQILKKSSLVLVEHFHKNALLENYDRIQLQNKRRLGDTCISLFGLNIS